MPKHFEPQRPARAMLEMLREVQPDATLHDLERALRAQRKRCKRAGQSDEARYFDVALAEVHHERAAIQARRAALPRLRPWHEHYGKGE